MNVEVIRAEHGAGDEGSRPSGMVPITIVDPCSAIRDRLTVVAENGYVPANRLRSGLG